MPCRCQPSPQGDPLEGDGDIATFSFTDAYLTVNATDLSNDASSLTLELSADELEDTAFGDTYKSRIGGLKDSSWSVDFNQDFAASQVDATLFPLLGTVVTVAAKPVNTTTASTNPQYSGSALISQYSPFGNKVGELAAVSVQWPGAGTITRATSP